MKMKPGLKAFLYFMFAAVFIGFGFWVGRGFPQTWEAVLHPAVAATPQRTPEASLRADSMESRITALEEEVAFLRSEMRTSREAAPGTPPSAAQPSPGSERAPLEQPQGSGATPAPRDSETGVDYR